MAFASYAAAGLLSPLYLPVLMVFSNVDVTQVYSFLKDTVLGDLPLVLTMVRHMLLFTTIRKRSADRRKASYHINFSRSCVIGSVQNEALSGLPPSDGGYVSQTRPA